MGISPVRDNKGISLSRLLYYTVYRLNVIEMNVIRVLWLRCLWVMFINCELDNIDHGTV